MVTIAQPVTLGRDKLPRSLSALLLTRILAIVVLSFALFALAAYWLVIGPLQNNRAQTETSRAADQTAASMLSTIGSSARALQTAAAGGLSGQFSIDVPADFVRTFIPVMRYRPQIASVQLVAEGGRELMLARGGNDFWRVRAVDAVRKPDRQQLSTWSDRGELLKEETSFAPYDPRQEDWYKAGFSAPNELAVTWSTPYIFDSGFVGMPALTRWRSKAGGQQLLALNVSLADLSTLTRSTKIGNEGRVAVTTLAGGVLAVPKDTSLTTPESVREVLLRPAQESGFEVIAAAHKGWVEAQRPERGFSEFRAYGSDWVADVRSVTFGSQRMLVIAGVSVADFAPPLKSALLGLLLLGAVIAAAATVARAFARTLSGSVRDLVAQSERIGRKELDTPVQLRTPAAELDQLVRAQEQMRGRLLEATRDLEERVHERTADLEKTTQRLAVENVQRVKSDERTRLILNSASEGIFGVDAEERVTFFNDMAASLLGYSADDVAGREIYSLIQHSTADGTPLAPEDRPMHMACATGKSAKVSGEALWRKDGSWFISEYSVTPIVDEKDGAAGAVVVFRDITEQRKNQEELQQRMDELERFNRLTMGREERMIQLKLEINALLEERGAKRKYKDIDAES